MASAALAAYLFGAITTTTQSDLVAFAVLSAIVLLVTHGLGRYLFAVSNDEEYATASGLPVLPLNLLLAVMTAVTVVVSMRVVGLLLILILDALMLLAADNITNGDLSIGSFWAALLVAFVAACGGKKEEVVYIEEPVVAEPVLSKY